MSMALQEIDAAEQVPLSSCKVPIRNLWHMLLYAWDQIAIRDRWRVEVEHAPTLDALLASVLSRLVQQRLRVGLGRSYTEETRGLKSIKGRVDFGRSVKTMSLQRGEAFCHFYEFSPNVLKNQIVRSTLDRIARLGNFGTDRPIAEALRQRLRRLVRDLDSIELIPLNLETIRRQQLARNDNDYRVMLAICELLLRRYMPTEDAGDGFLPDIDRDTLTLHHVFETFVTRFYELRLAGWNVRPQISLNWNAQKASPYLPNMRPDIVFERHGSGELTILDTKFTATSLTGGRFGRLTFNSDHIYQIYAYLRSQEAESEAYRASTGILLYPTVGHALAEEIEVQGHVIRFETVDLALPWQDIEKRLLKILDSVGGQPSPILPN